MASEHTFAYRSAAHAQSASDSTAHEQLFSPGMQCTFLSLFKNIFSHLFAKVQEIGFWTPANSDTLEYKDLADKAV
jgi:hypothetical protein